MNTTQRRRMGSRGIAPRIL